MENVIEKTQLLALPEFVKSRKYWQQTLEKKTEETRLPYSFFQTLDYERQQYRFQLDAAVGAQVEKASKGNAQAMYIILFAAYRVLLYKYMGQQCLELGAPTLARPDQSNDFFTAQILPIYDTLRPENNFKEFLKAEKDNLTTAYLHQHYPLSSLEAYKTPKSAVFLKNIHPFYQATALDLVWEKQGEALDLQCIYNGKLFSAAFIQNFTHKYEHALRCLLANAGVAIEDLSLLEAEEERTLHEINYTSTPYSSDSNLVHAFKEWATQTPDAVAVVTKKNTLTYRQLDLYSDQIAHYLTNTVRIASQEPIGILLPKSAHTIACMVGILKAGGAYLPISPRYPADRIRMILKDSGVKTILSTKAHIKLLNKLQWECPDFRTYLCIDSLDCHREKEESTFKNELNSQKLWEYVGETATDDIEGGGWQNSYTGENLSRAEMDEYRDNIVRKIIPLLPKNARVLEIGCASGISMFELAPHTALYYGTDLSRVIIEKNKQTVSDKSITNIKLKSLAAHEIAGLDEKDFDLVIINSVIQCFEGHNYLRDVLAKVVHLMKDNGIIFIGDVMDEDTRETFLESLTTFKKNNIGKGYKVKTDFSNEIFYARKFFEDLRFDIEGIAQVRFSNKIHTIENELTRYRYDAIITVNKGTAPVKATRHKYQHSLAALTPYEHVPYRQTAIKPDALAYVIYTSGSTGKPKGVMATHRNVLRVVQNTNYVTFERGDKLLQPGPMEFDASTFDIWGSLTHGLSMHIIDPELLLDAPKLKAYISENQITISFVITAAFIALIEQDATVFDGLKYLLVGGEAMSTRHMNKLLAHNAYTKIYHVYGPTENTVFSTAHLVNKQYTGAVPIGKPISNSTCYVLDNKLRLVIPGGEGILYVGGDGVAKGYLNSPELTRQRFVENPFQPGEWLYNSGDLVRWNEDYALEFVGRIDTQVKIRGFRIDLAEIENELLNISGIREARVLLKTNDQEDKSLVAYFTATAKITSEEIVSLLADKLPDYMIPSALLQLEALPLNANGKLDVAKLPDPVMLSKGLFEAPTGEIEEQLAEIWKEVLGVSVVSAHDNFFQLGGHSLKAMKVLHRLSKDFELKLTTLFTYPTIRELARNLVHKKDNLLETLRRLKKEPLSEAVIQSAEARKAWYRDRIKQDNFVIPGEPQAIQSVLLTGSTGYLGIHLLYELLTRTEALVSVLIRAENETAAEARLTNKLSFFFGPEFYARYASRIKVIPGEMASPSLGINAYAYQQLAADIDTIINPAANVKHYGLEAAYKGNTVGVEELVKLAKTGRPKRVHHVSTAGVAFGQNYLFSEYDRVEKIPQENNTIYLQSKLDAENIIFKAIEEGVEATIYRVGNLVFNYQTGKFQDNTENNAFYMLLRSFINLGMVPDMHHKFYDFSYINTTAEAIVQFAKQKSLINEVFHAYNTHSYSLRDLYELIIKPHFPQIQLVSLDDFPGLILQKYEYPRMKEFIEHLIVNVRILEINESNVMLIAERSQGIMEKLQIHWPPLDEKLARMMVDFGQERRFW